MSFKKLNLALLVLFISFFFLIFSFHYQQTRNEMNKIITEELRKTLLDMKLDMKDMLNDRLNIDIKAYLHRKKASADVIKELYLIQEDDTLVSTSDDLYDKKYFHIDNSVDLRGLDTVNIAKVDWIGSVISVMNNEGEERYILFVKICHEYIEGTIQTGIVMQMLYPLLFFVGLALFYILYIKRMIIKPVMIIDEFLRGMISKIPKFYILEFNNLAKNIENNLTSLKTMAYFDTLTGLYNRQGMAEIIKEHIAEFNGNHVGFTMAMVDLDHFKKINDTSGHEVGDALLQEVTKALKKELNNTDSIGRLGGDEFLMLFKQENIAELSHTLERIVQRFQKPFMVKNKELYIEASIGISAYPEDGGDISTLLKHADFAMYQAKQQGGNTFSFFSKELGEKINMELTLEAEIKNGMEQNEFFLVYQPIVDTQSEKIVSVEALARWKHPKKGMIYPCDFISVIEGGCCVKEFGEWVIDTACAQQQEWFTRGIDIDLSLNLSVKHIMSSNFYMGLEKLVKKHQTNLNRLRLEITEYTLMEYKGTTLSVLKKMKENGYHFILDDFGTGYSSITYLQNTPIEAVKIDKSFIDQIDQDKNDAQMLDAIIGLTKVIGLPSIAEGVEEAYQVSYLKNAGCDLIQGYYYSKPLESKELEAFYWENLSS